MGIEKVAEVARDHASLDHPTVRRIDEQIRPSLLVGTMAGPDPGL